MSNMKKIKEIDEVEWNKEDNHIYMTGPAVTVFEGELE